MIKFGSINHARNLSLFNTVHRVGERTRHLLPCVLSRIFRWSLRHALLFRFQQPLNLSNQSHQFCRIVFLRGQLAQFHPVFFIVPDHSGPSEDQEQLPRITPQLPTCRGLGLIPVAALSLHCVRRRRIGASPLGTDHDGKPGCQLSQTSCMFCEGSFQVFKNLTQLGRLRSRGCFVAKLPDPIFESLKHGPEAEKGASIVPQTGACVRYSTYCRRLGF
jgi:hypothetical protein